jgi:hypothetical protein
MKELSEILSEDKRDEIRRECLERGGWYSPWLHLGITSCVGLGVIGVAVSLLHDVKGWQIAFGLFLLLLSNATEWRLHRDVLHRRRWFAPILYDRHTPEHHMIFTTEDMAIRSAREMRLVLIPAFGIVGAFVGLLPIMALVWIGWPRPLFSPVDQHNLAAIFAIETMGYIVSYEWLHLSYHLAPDSFIGSLGLIRFLRRHHAIHHDPRLMQRWNFNVTLPLWDVLRRTYVTDRERALAEPRG